MKKKDFDIIVQLVANQLVGFLMEDYGMSMLEAFDKTYNSQIFHKLQDKKHRSIPQKRSIHIRVSEKRITRNTSCLTTINLPGIDNNCPFIVFLALSTAFFQILRHNAFALRFVI